MTISSALGEILQQEIRSRKLPDSFITTVEQWYLPLAEQIVRAKQQAGRACFEVSFNGAQGSGKSTITAFLRLLLTHQFGLYTVEVSIDDFYLTRSQREVLSKTVHPLFITRGVPGTHDVRLARQTFDCLRHCDSQHPCYVPTFDKAVDDRRARSEWTKVGQAVDIILFEGWCNHAPLQTDEELENPLNDLEREEDADGTWRRYVNEQIRRYQAELFSQADFLVYLQVPSFEKVYEWRGLQESKLAAQKTDKSAVMDTRALRRFIQHYERITRHCLKVLPAEADVLVRLGDDHQIQSMHGKEAVA